MGQFVALDLQRQLSIIVMVLRLVIRIICYLLIRFSMFSWYLYFTLPIFIHAYSALTVVSLVTPISTRRLFSNLFPVKRRIFSNPSQYLPMRKLPKPRLQSSQVWLKSTKPFSLYCITVHPQPAVVCSQYTSKGALSSGQIV